VLCGWRADRPPLRRESLGSQRTMEDALTPRKPQIEPQLSISVDVRPGEYAAVGRWGVARTFRWRALLSPALLLAAAGFVVSLLHVGPCPLTTVLMAVLLGAVGTLGAYIGIPYMVGARLARSVSRSRVQLTFTAEGVRVDRAEGQFWLAWADVQAMETADMLHFVSQHASCYLPKRVVTPGDEVLLRQLMAAASGRVLPTRSPSWLPNQRLQRPGA
jgi:hypothetical protein